MKWITLLVLELLVVWVVIPSTLLHAWGPKPHWLVGRVDSARAWSIRSMNHRSCYLEWNLYLSSWTWIGILEYYPFESWHAGLVGGWLVDGEKTWSGEICDSILKKKRWQSVNGILIKLLEQALETPYPFKRICEFLIEVYWLILECTVFL